MSYTLLQTQKPSEMVDRLNGVIFSKPIQSTRIDGPTGSGTDEVINGLNGKALVFTTPVVTVTFATADPVPVASMLAEIDAQVKAVDSAFEASLVNGGGAPSTLNPLAKVLKMLTGTPAGLVLNLAGSTAAALLGFDTAGTLSGIPIDPLKIVGGGDTISGGLYILLAP